MLFLLSSFPLFHSLYIFPVLMYPPTAQITVFVANTCRLQSTTFINIQVSEESAEAWVDEFTTSGPDFQQAKAAVEVREEFFTNQALNPKLKLLCSRSNVDNKEHCVLEAWGLKMENLPKLFTPRCL